MNETERKRCDRIGRCAAATLLLALTASCAIFSGRHEAEIQGLIGAGRVLLDERKPAEAQTLFEEAARLDDDSLRTRMWVLRSWMEQRRSNDTLDALDALARDGRKGPEMDYLYGMAFARRAEDNLRAGVTDSSIQMNFQDAFAHLPKALEDDPERYRDGFLPLARAAWFCQELETSRTAANNAVEFYPSVPEASLMLGRVALSQFQVARDPESFEPSAWNQATRDHLQAARDAFHRTTTLLDPAPDDGERRLLFAEACLQLGHAEVWLQAFERAAEAYAGAVAWNPTGVDYGLLRDILNSEQRPNAFRDMLETAFAEHEAAFGEDSAAGPLLNWWLGYARYEAEAFAESEESFLATLERDPSIGNAWFYVAFARYAQEDFEGAIGALLSGWANDPSAVLAEMGTGDPELNVAKVSYLVGLCARSERPGPAAVLSEICAEAVRDDARYWNDLGLFLRDEGDRLADSSLPPAAELLREYYERSLLAYERALELAPDDPQILNDTAVMLHYYLKRDDDRARAMYGKAQERARTLLAGEELTEELRPIVETALEDATNNLKRLDRGQREDG